MQAHRRPTRLWGGPTAFVERLAIGGAFGDPRYDPVRCRTTIVTYNSAGVAGVGSSTCIQSHSKPSIALQIAFYTQADTTSPCILACLSDVAYSHRESRNSAFKLHMSYERPRPPRQWLLAFDSLASTQTARCFVRDDRPEYVAWQTNLFIF